MPPSRRPHLSHRLVLVASGGVVFGGPPDLCCRHKHILVRKKANLPPLRSFFSLTCAFILHFLSFHLNFVSPSSSLFSAYPHSSQLLPSLHHPLLLLLPSLPPFLPPTQHSRGGLWSSRRQCHVDCQGWITQEEGEEEGVPSCLVRKGGRKGGGEAAATAFEEAADKIQTKGEEGRKKSEND